MPSGTFVVTAGELEPITVTIDQTKRITGESRSKIYERIANGEYDAVKSGSRTLIIYQSIKRHVASLPRAVIKPPAPRKRRELKPADTPLTARPPVEATARRRAGLAAPPRK